MKRKKEHILYRIYKKLKEFDTYDRVYYDGKLISAIIFFLSMVFILLIILLVAVL